MADCDAQYAFLDSAPKERAARKLTIMHVIDSGGLYGAERVLLDLGTACQQLGHRVIVAPIIAPEDDADPLGDAALDSGLEVMRFTIPDGVRLNAFRAVADAARSEKVDVLHSHGYKANILFALQRVTRRSCPVLATLHGWTARRSVSKMGAYELLERALLMRLDKVVAVSATIKARVPRLLDRGAGVEVIPNGIAASAGTKCAVDPRVSDFVDGRPAILAAGRLSAEKGFDVLLEAMSQVVRHLPEARLVIAGEGPERTRLESQTWAQGLRHNVLMPGYVPDVRRMMGLFRLYALSSHTEGSPAVVLEAMAEGLPVVATGVGDIPRMLEYGRCGYLVVPGDSHRLAAGLCDVLGDAGMRQRLSDAGKARLAACYSASKMARAYQQLYLELAAGSAVTWSAA